MTGQADTVATSALDGHHHPRSRSHVDDPGQQLGEAGLIIIDLACPDRDAGRERDLHLVGVAVGVDTDDGVDEFANMGTGLSFLHGVGLPSAPVWVEVTEAAHL
jgi:hypothetical protein